jgi:hypothetical protein
VEARPAAIDGAVSSGGGNGGRGIGRGGERMGWQRRFGWSGGVWEASRWLEVSRAAALRPVAGGGLGCLTRGGRGTTVPSGPSWVERPSGPGALGGPISEKKQKEK